MKVYNQLSQRERKRLYGMQQSGLSIDRIAKRLGRHRSTLYRELKRNRYSKRYYLPDTAHKKALERKARKAWKIIPDSPLYHYIRRKLIQGWSPEQISGRLKQQKKPYYASPETIYAYIYKSREGKLWYQYLFRARPLRGKRKGRKIGSRKYLHIRLIDKRPDEVNTRQSIGHWEGDTIAFSASKYINVTTLVERKSRYVMLKRNESRKSQHVMGAIAEKMKLLRQKYFRRLTLDQGSEFADFVKLENKTRCQVYYCNPHSPWQRGTNENTNGRLRRYLPRNFKLDYLTQQRLDKLSKIMNNLPRKCLGFRTPNEALRLNNNNNCRASL